MLHCAKSNLVDHAMLTRISAALTMLQSSSPSYLLMASLDAAAAQVACVDALQGPLDAARGARVRLEDAKARGALVGVGVLDEGGVRARCGGGGACWKVDPLRVVVCVERDVLGMDGMPMGVVVVVVGW